MVFRYGALLRAGVIARRGHHQEDDLFFLVFFFLVSVVFLAFCCFVYLWGAKEYVPWCVISFRRQKQERTFGIFSIL